MTVKWPDPRIRVQYVNREKWMPLSLTRRFSEGVNHLQLHWPSEAISKKVKPIKANFSFLCAFPQGFVTVGVCQYRMHILQKFVYFLSIYRLSQTELINISHQGATMRTDIQTNRRPMRNHQIYVRIL